MTKFLQKLTSLLLIEKIEIFMDQLPLKSQINQKYFLQKKLSQI